MSSIRILPDRVANQIAAGEVIERPAAVVKELVENSLDAGATRIAVEFQDGGRALIRVEDNGRGMGRDDAMLAFERHATSKIAEAADLDRLNTFGFRGEALPSIASVSRCTLQTRSGNGNATEVLIDGGKLAHARECGRPLGTTVEVAHLFHPVPARRKFLKADRTEAAHIVQTVRLYALAFPAVAFSLMEDGRLTFRSPACAGLADRAAEIFGRQLAAELLPIAGAEGGLKLSGLVGRPGLGRATRHEMVTFVNFRPVESRTLAYALIESYHQSIPKGRFPAAILFLECDPSTVDVNVHPAKREVRFREEAAVRGFVIRTVLQRLREIEPPGMGEGSSAASAALEAKAGLAPAVAIASAAAPPASVAMGAVRAAPYAAASAASAVPEAGAESPRANVTKAWRFIGLAHGNTAIFETAAGLVLLDRRAAHERVWYERLRAQFQSGGCAGQRLLLPVPLELDAVTSDLLIERQAFLEAHGFEVAAFGRNFFRIESVPAWMEPADAEPFLRDILAALREGLLGGENLDAAREQLARIASARAVRLPPLSRQAEIDELVAELFATESPLSSPAGRPTCVEISHGELARRFHK